MSPPSGRVLVTGLAASTPLGEGAETFLDALARAGLDPERFRNGEERRFHPLPETVATHPRIRSTHPLTMRLVWTADTELGQFLAALTDDDRERTGVSIGHAYGHLNSYLDYFDAATQQGYRVVHPLRFLSTLTNYAAAEINNSYSLWGSSVPVGTGWNAGLEAIGAAVHALTSGDEESMIAGGFEEVGECTRQVLQASRAHASPQGSRNGSGPGAGEGIGLLLLQRQETAARTGRSALAEIGPVLSVHGLRWDEPASLRRAADCVRESIEQSGARPADVGAVYSSAASLAHGDAICEEIQTLVMGREAAHATRVDVAQTVGQCFAAMGPLQCVAAVAAVSPRARAGRKAAVVFTPAGDGAFSAVTLRTPESMD